MAGCASKCSRGSHRALTQSLRIRDARHPANSVVWCPASHLVGAPRRRTRLLGVAGKKLAPIGERRSSSARSRPFSPPSRSRADRRARPAVLRSVAFSSASGGGRFVAQPALSRRSAAIRKCVVAGNFAGPGMRAYARSRTCVQRGRPGCSPERRKPDGPTASGPR
jgi:hypothetical protein